MIPLKYEMRFYESIKPDCNFYSMLLWHSGCYEIIGCHDAMTSSKHHNTNKTWQPGRRSWNLHFSLVYAEHHAGYTRAGAPPSPGRGSGRPASSGTMRWWPRWWSWWSLYGGVALIPGRSLTLGRSGEGTTTDNTTISARVCTVILCCGGRVGHCHRVRHTLPPTHTQGRAAGGAPGPNIQPGRGSDINTALRPPLPNCRGRRAVTSRRQQFRQFRRPADQWERRTARLTNERSGQQRQLPGVQVCSRQVDRQ